MTTCRGRGQSRSARSLTLTAAAHRDGVARVGTTAWAAFLSACFDVEEDDRGQLLTQTSARALARDLGISKDTAARALARLVDVGFLVRVGQRRGAGGRFAATTYRIRRRTAIELALCSGTSDTGGLRSVAAGMPTPPAPRRVGSVPSRRPTWPVPVGSS